MESLEQIKRFVALLNVDLKKIIAELDSCACWYTFHVTRQMIKR